MYVSEKKGDIGLNKSTTHRSLLPVFGRLTCTSTKLDELLIVESIKNNISKESRALRRALWAERPLASAGRGQTR